MAWTVEYNSRARDQLYHLDRQTSRRVTTYMDQVGELRNPRQKGRPLSGPLAGRWRYRVGNYRVICEIQDEVLVVLVIEIGHRSQVYRR